jgi:hypothetical protein
MCERAINMSRCLRISWVGKWDHETVILYHDITQVFCCIPADVDVSEGMNIPLTGVMPLSRQGDKEVIIAPEHMDVNDGTGCHDGDEEEVAIVDPWDPPLEGIFESISTDGEKSIAICMGVEYLLDTVIIPPREYRIKYTLTSSMGDGFLMHAHVVSNVVHGNEIPHSTWQAPGVTLNGVVTSFRRVGDMCNIDMVSFKVSIMTREDPKQGWALSVYGVMPGTTLFTFFRRVSQVS